MDKKGFMSLATGILLLLVLGLFFFAFPIVMAIIQHGSTLMVVIIAILIYYVFIKGKR